ncbi:alpha-(1,3)-fucosyltransferase C-like [Lingula anatina]|uniref:Fucosyltransferase n=1 Tax=Lingula anatina TaxID=7574 RepID=A0A1S3HH60_LINAN|nr:alpha-(1,3)-fucosyltransferase C-like [Lingula anatina]|eukprot:XP_013385410.1 alpha-(1,3)-fucosyltransferase C-like [Lingula anatina]
MSLHPNRQDGTGGSKRWIKLSFFYVIIFTAVIISLLVYKSWDEVVILAKHKQSSAMKGFLNATDTPKSLSNNTGILQPKMILYWRVNKSCAYFTLTKPGPSFKDLNCPVNNCVWTDDKAKVKEADAVLFFDHCLKDVIPPQDRNPQGRWVLVNHESPCHVNTFKVLSQWDGLFNWTMTYTKDSDIYSPYAQVIRNDGDSPVLSRERSLSIARNKSSLVAWMVSNCRTLSKREKYVEELDKYIPVDVYGRCGPLACERRSKRCSKILSDYKFYLAFENSLSKDYVTEKFFNMIPMNVIPITRSGANFSRLGIPSALHIDTRDFKSPKDLAEYLKRLDQDDESYAALLRAKSNYKLLSWKHSYCDLCKKLNDPKEQSKSYSTLEIKEQLGSCVPPNDLQHHHFLQNRPEDEIYMEVPHN